MAKSGVNDKTYDSRRIVLPMLIMMTIINAASIIPITVPSASIIATALYSTLLARSYTLIGSTTLSSRAKS